MDAIGNGLGQRKPNPRSQFHRSLPQSGSVGWSGALQLWLWWSLSSAKGRPDASMRAARGLVGVRGTEYMRTRRLRLSAGAMRHCWGRRSSAWEHNSMGTWEHRRGGIKKARGRNRDKDDFQAALVLAECNPASGFSAASLVLPSSRRQPSRTCPH